MTDAEIATLRAELDAARADVVRLTGERETLAKIAADVTAGNDVLAAEVEHFDILAKGRADRVIAAIDRADRYRSCLAELRTEFEKAPSEYVWSLSRIREAMDVAPEHFSVFDAPTNPPTESHDRTTTPEPERGA